MPWFLVMGIDGTTNFGPSLLLPSGTILTAPALVLTPGSEAESLQHLDGEPVLVLQSGNRNGENHLVRVSLAEGRLEIDPISRPQLMVRSLGNPSDASLVWGEVDESRVVTMYRKTLFSEPAQELCRVEARSFTRFLGDRNGWAAWQIGWGRPRAVLCNLLTGETRKVDLEAKGLWDFLD